MCLKLSKEWEECFSDELMGSGALWAIWVQQYCHEGRLASEQNERERERVIKTDRKSEWERGKEWFMHFYAFFLADTFIQSDLQCIQATHFFFISMCVPWELNPQPFALLTQCSTTEPQEHSVSVCFTSVSVWLKEIERLRFVVDVCGWEMRSL